MPKKSDSAPEFVRFIGPLLAALEELGGSGRPDEVRTAIANTMNISEAEQARRLPSGVQSRFENQVHRARFYLAKGGYIDASRHGVWTLTERARGVGKVSAGQGREIYRTVAAEFRKSRGKASPPEDPHAAEEHVAPASEAEHAFANYRESVAASLQALPAAGFERFCQRLLRESGFEEVTVTGRSGDGGIDGIGILQVNALVSFKVLGMINGAHTIIYSRDPEADRAFLQDGLGLPHVDVGEGWLIFGLPPSEVAVHPSGRNDLHEFYLMCDDVKAFITAMKKRKVACAPVKNLGWGLLTRISLPGGGSLGVYQPRHARPKSLPLRRAARRMVTGTGRRTARKIAWKATGRR